MMAANYWESTQHSEWLLTESDLSKNFTNLQSDILSKKHWNQLKIFLNVLVARLCTRLRLCQYVRSTAAVYLMRILTKTSILEWNIYQLVTACVYVASKIEESSVTYRSILSEAKYLWPGKLSHYISQLSITN